MKGRKGTKEVKKPTTKKNKRAKGKKSTRVPVEGEDEHEGCGDDHEHDPPGASEVPAPRRRRRLKPVVEETVDFTVPKDSVEAPANCPTNLIYSKAYFIVKKAGGSIDDCRHAGKHASWLLREKKLVAPSLSGCVSYTPKPRKDKVDDADDIPKTKKKKTTPAKNSGKRQKPMEDDVNDAAVATKP